MPTQPSDIRARLLKLGTGELVAAAVFVGVVAGSVQPKVGAAAARPLWFAVAPLVLVLLQAGCYWLLRRRWLPGAPPSWFGLVAQVLRVANPVVLLGCGIAAWATASSAGPGVVLLCVLAWLFGLIEYLNYFVVRLAYPLSSWAAEVTKWRRPRVIQDLNAMRSR